VLAPEHFAIVAASVRSLPTSATGIDAALLLSAHGRVLVSALPDDLDPTRAAALAHELLNRASAMAEAWRRNDVVRVIVRGDRGDVIIADAGRDMFLVVGTDHTAALGSVMLEVDSARRSIRAAMKAVDGPLAEAASPPIAPAAATAVSSALLVRHDAPAAPEAPPVTATSPVRRTLPRTDAFTVCLHWGLVATLVTSLVTGLSIAGDYAASAIGPVADLVAPVLPQGPVIEWHVLSGWALCAIMVAYPVFLWRSRQAHRVKLNRFVWIALSNARRSGTLFANVGALFALNRIVHAVAFVLVLMMAATGLALYASTPLPVDREIVAAVHGVTALSFVGYVVIHVAIHAAAGNLWKIFRPRAAHLAVAAIAMCVAGAAIAAAYVVDRTDYRDLKVAHVTPPPVLDGDASDIAWQKTGEVVIRTRRGANFPGGEVTVTARAVHDGERAYFLFRWADPQRSQKHLPLLKTERGWRVLQSKLDVNDEDDFYEDKFAVLLSRTSTVASGTVHLGRNLIPGPHRPTNRGLHYTSDGSYADMWHWKSVRTGAMRPGMADDNHFGPPQPSEKPGVRYTGGYGQDPKTGGEFSENWTKVDADKPLAETLVVPKYLPHDPALLARMGPIDLDPEAGDAGIWYLRAEETRPYRPELDIYPVGTVLPGVVIDGGFTGDRGDVRAEAQWRDGFWTLEMSRALDTGSAFDVPLVASAEARSVFLWVAAFNHSQTRHSRHLHPVRLIIDDVEQILNTRVP
jgi:predicted regulator of Ras-like GTPase activity (Roadblock/LC7/MglB family)